MLRISGVLFNSHSHVLHALLFKVWDRRLLDENCPCPVGVFAGHADGITHIDPRVSC